MNLQAIKLGGARLGLEAELNVQRRAFVDALEEARKDPKVYSNALVALRNCIELVEELMKVIGIQ